MEQVQNSHTYIRYRSCSQKNKAGTNCEKAEVWLRHTNYITSLASVPTCCLVSPLQLDLVQIWRGMVPNWKAGQGIEGCLKGKYWRYLNDLKNVIEQNYCPPACTLRMWLMLNYERSLPGLVVFSIYLVLKTNLVQRKTPLCIYM